MIENTIVTLADSNYFQMLDELVDSINKHPESKNVSICVLNAGLTEDQVNIIKKKVVTKYFWLKSKNIVYFCI